jgi:superfamily II DNA or RNA helicase
MIVAESVSSLVEQGYLLPERIYAPYVPKLEHVRVRQGDFDVRELEEVMTERGVVGNIVETWKEKAEGRITVAFCATRKHSQRLAEEFTAAGVPAGHLDFKSSREERRFLLAAHRRGDVPVLCNVNILTEGWDSPEDSCAIMARPTKSLSLYIQMGGRILRPYPGQTEALLLDHAGNALRHGLLTEDRNWSLDKARRISKKEHIPALKTCECYALLPPALMVCPLCGHEFQASEVEVELEDGSLIEIDRDIFEKISEARWKLLQHKLIAWADLEKVRLMKGYKAGWSVVQFKRLYGHYPTREIKSVRNPVRTKSAVRDRPRLRSSTVAADLAGQRRGGFPNW